jgi:hypothetical protein
VLVSHVKWFADYNFADPPITIPELLTPTFFALAGLSVVTILLLILLEEWADRTQWVQKIDRWLESKNEYAVLILRIGTGATLIWCWQAGTLLAPDLVVQSEWMLWAQFLIAGLFVFVPTLPLAGIGILALYAIGVSQFGFFHMLDYLLFLGVGYFFIANASKIPRIHLTALPALYSTLGFCLFWLGIEKMIYPGWSKILLDEHPVLTLGFSHDFFILAAAFIEISLGFMIMACLQQRLLALIITLVFFLTTLVFGRQEVVGHTLIHAVLLVFIIAGPGKATPPLYWVHGLGKRLSTSALTFLALIAAFLIPYAFGAGITHDSANFQTDQAHGASLSGDHPDGHSPGLAIAIHKDAMSGWNLELVTDNFEFDPAAASGPAQPGKGHAHLYIDGKKAARLYGHWYHIPVLTPGQHRIEVTLNANNHATITTKGEPVRATAVIEVVK